MSTLTIPNSFTNGPTQIIDAVKMNANFAAITTVVNGGLDHSNLSSSAAITMSQLSLAPGGAALNKTTSAGITWASALTTDTTAQIQLTSDAGLQWGPGGVTAPDVRLIRSAANTLQIGTATGGTGCTLDMNSGLITNATSIALKNTNAATITPASMAASRAITMLDPLAAANLVCADSTLVNHDLCTFNGARITRLAPGAGGQYVVSNGTNFISSAPYQSAGQTITAAGALTLTHGLGYTPVNVWVALVNGTGEAGYTAGQQVYVAGSPGAANTGVSIITGATTLTVRFGSAATTFSIPHATTGANTALTNANWTLVVFAM